MRRWVLAGVLGLLAAASEAGVITFLDIAVQAGITYPGNGRGVSLGDLEEDGDLDIWTFNVGDLDDKLYRNDGTARFDDITASAQVAGEFGGGRGMQRPNG